jgi:hypothetical protein
LAGDQLYHLLNFYLFALSASHGEMHNSKAFGKKGDKIGQIGDIEICYTICYKIPLV